MKDPAPGSVLSQTRPDAPRFDDSDNQAQSKIRIDMQIRSKN